MTTSTRKVSRLPIDRQRAEFLRSCRARIQPADLGLPSPQRKRTEGLRREDVAALSGVSVAWYTWLEQGREMRVSDEVLERVCNTFRLSGDERAYLFSLVQRRPPRPQRELASELPAEVGHMLQAVAVPALVTNLRWDVLGWNRLSQQLIRDYGALAQNERNLVELIFRSPQQVGDPADFERMARRILEKLRVDYSNAGDDPRFESLIQRLDQGSPMFRRMWRRPEINARSFGTLSLLHPQHGLLAFENTNYAPEGYPGMRVTLCTPADEHTSEVVARVLADQPRAARPAP